MRRSGWVLAIITLLLSVFAGRAWNAVQLESATYDEPGHLLSGYAALTLHDFRLDTEHPPLWKYWAALPDAVVGGFGIDTGSDAWSKLLGNRSIQSHFIGRTLFETPGNDTESFLSRARFMMLLVGVALGGLIALWAWRLGGPVAAVVSVFVYSLDPNFLGHSPLVNNDVGLSLAFCGVMYATWRVGQLASWPRLLRLAGALAVAVLVKYSALVASPLLVLLLILNALVVSKWVVLEQEIKSRARRVAIALAIGAGCLFVTWGAVWACYGFRFGIAPDPAVRPDLEISVRYEALRHWRGQNPDAKPTRELIDAEPPSVTTALLLEIDHARLLPESLLDGVLHMSTHAGNRRMFLLGSLAWVGRWTYFPIAVLVKTPLATLAAFVLAIGLLLSRRRWRSEGASTQTWDLLCLALPPALFFAAAMRTDLNIGLRHIFPVYPFLFIGVGVAAARSILLWPRLSKRILAALAICLLAESFAASPDYLAYFNMAAGGSRGGLALLGDSNLDWGQGLKQLARWESAHPDEPVQLAYFGMATPEYYGVKAQLAMKASNDPLQIHGGPGVIAVSAQVLQGLTLDPVPQPVEVLGGSIYLYRANDFVRSVKASPGAPREAGEP